jgi:hypothetical protein
MNVDEEILPSWSELALQDLLIDVAAVVDATGFDRPSSILSAPNQTRSTAGIIQGMRRSGKMNALTIEGEKNESRYQVNCKK